MSFLDLMDEDLEEIECEIETQPPLQHSSSPVSTTSRPWGRPPRGSSKSSRNWTKIELLCLIEKKKVEYEIRHNQNARNVDIMKYGQVAWQEIIQSLNLIKGFREQESAQIQSK